MITQPELSGKPGQAPTVAINNNSKPSEGVLKRRMDPWGNLRGANPAWPSDRGFLNKPIDSTGLTAIGARYYDANFGRFISVDPIMNLSDPGQWGPYEYANNNPVTHSDPTGRLISDWRIDDLGTVTTVNRKISQAQSRGTGSSGRGEASAGGPAGSHTPAGSPVSLAGRAGSAGLAPLVGAARGSMAHGTSSQEGHGDGAVGYCGNLTAGAGVFASIGMCLYFPNASTDQSDELDTTGLTFSFSHGSMAGVSASADAGVIVTTANNLNQLQGSASVAGASGKIGASPMVAAEYSWGTDANGKSNGSAYIGGGLGLGTPEVHLGTSHTNALTLREVKDFFGSFF